MFVFGGYRHERELGDCKELHLSELAAPRTWHTKLNPGTPGFGPQAAAAASSSSAAAHARTVVQDCPNTSPPSSEDELRGSDGEEHVSSEAERVDAPWPGAEASSVSLQLLLALLRDR